MHDENGSLLKAFLSNRWVRAILVIDVIVIIIVTGVYIRQSNKNSTISFNVVPISATISVNGNTKYTNGQYSITPGTYKIAISYEGLETKTLSVTVEPHSFVSVTTFLSGADNSFEYYELKNNFMAYQKLKTIASADNNLTTDNDTTAQEFIANFERKMSIFNVLPLNGYIYSEPAANASTGGFVIQKDQSEKKCNKSACLLIRYFGKDYEEAALQKIKEAGYNPDDYQIIYERYT